MLNGFVRSWDRLDVANLRQDANAGKECGDVVIVRPPCTLDMLAGRKELRTELCLRTQSRRSETAYATRAC